MKNAVAEIKTMSRYLSVFLLSTLVLPGLCFAQDHPAHSPDTMKLKAKSHAMALFLADLGKTPVAKDNAIPIVDKAKETPVVEPCGHCTVNVDDAFAKSQREKRFICIWVGGCNSQICELLPECIHLVVPSWEGNAAKRLIVPTTLGNYSWDEKRMRSCPLCVEDEVRSLVIPVASISTAAYTYPVP